MKKKDLNEINWNEIQKVHDEGVFWCNLPQHFNISMSILKRGLNENFIIKKYHKYKHNNDIKEKLSDKRKQFLKNNPDKHPWKYNNFKSKPCEILKTLLIKNNINFISEYQPSNERFFAIDIAFPNKLIGIEINGNQHYNKDGTLKSYYKNREEFLNSLGWKIYNIHYSIIYNDLLLSKLIDEISNFSIDINDLEYYKNIHYKKIENNKNKCIDCGCDINNKAKRCVDCNGKQNRKTDRPSKEELKILIMNNTWISIGEKFGVSDNAVRKWAKKYNLI